MAMTAAERMARLRARQRTAGLATITLVVPTDDVDVLQRLAARRRRRHEQGGRDETRSVRWPRRPQAAHSTSISPADVLAFRELLETTAVGLVTRRLNPAMQRRLLAHVEREATLRGDAVSADFQQFHRLLGELSGDEPLQLLLRIALQLTDERSAFGRSRGGAREQVVHRIKRLHAGIVKAIIDRNEALAIRRMRSYLSGLREWLE